MALASWLQGCHTHPRISGHQETTGQWLLHMRTHAKFSLWENRLAAGTFSTRESQAWIFLPGYNRFCLDSYPMATHSASSVGTVQDPQATSPNFLNLAGHKDIKDRHIQSALIISSLPLRSLLRTYYVPNSGNSEEPA